MRKFCVAVCGLALLACLSGIALLGIGGDYVSMGVKALNGATILIIIAGLFSIPVAFHAWKMHWADPTNQRPTSAR